MAPPEALAALGTSFLDAFCSLDMERMLAIRAPDCVHAIGPASMDRPAMDNEAFRAAYAPALRHFRSMSMHTKSLLTDAQRDVVVLHVQSRAETTGPRYDMEYVFLLSATPDARRLVRVEELVDSARAKAQWAALMDAVREREEGEE